MSNLKLSDKMMAAIKLARDTNNPWVQDWRTGKALARRGYATPHRERTGAKLEFQLKDDVMKGWRP